MGLLDKITASMELTELKKFKLQKAILAMMLEWKHLEEHMDSTQHSFQECLDELQSKENYLNSVRESVVESNKEMESIRVSIEQKIKMLDDKANEFQVFQNEQLNAFDLKERSIEERIKLVELREEKLVAEQKVVEGIFKKFEVGEKQYKDIQKSVGERIEEIKTKEMQLEKRYKELESKAKELAPQESKATPSNPDANKTGKKRQADEPRRSDREPKKNPKYLD